MLFAGKEKRVMQYYSFLGDDILDEFYYMEKTDRHNSLENKSRLWLNCGYWKTARNYEDAGTEMARLVAKEGNITESSSILDVGCGFAEQDILWATEFGCKISGIDLTPLHVQVAQKRIKLAHLDHLVSVYFGNATLLRHQQNSSYTHVIALECAFHFNTREKFLKEAFRVLSPGGILVLTDLLPKPGRDYSAFVQRLGRWYTSIPGENMYDIHVYKKILENIGFGKITILDISDDVFPGFSYYGTGKQSSHINLLPEIPPEFF